MNVALTIAGSDPSGGAGLQADLKTFQRHGVYGMSVVTLLTVQNTRTVSEVQVLEADFVGRQLDALLADIPPQAAKTGALGNRSVIEAVADHASHFEFPLVVDPVMISKHGAPLLDHDAIDALKTKLLPYAFLVTPNLPEASELVGFEVKNETSMRRAATAIAQMGSRHVLIKGGHLDGQPIDLLWSDGQVTTLPAERVDTKHTHGTGCVFSSAITARLAQGEAVLSAVRGAKQFITLAIQSSPGLGKGFGPVNLFVD